MQCGYFKKKKKAITSLFVCDSFVSDYMPFRVDTNASHQRDDIFCVCQTVVREKKGKKKSHFVAFLEGNLIYF